MVVIRKILWVVGLLFMVQSTFAATAAENLQSQLDRITTLSADFVQTVYDEHGKAIQETHGSLSIKRPGQFRWQVKQPLPQLIITRGDKVWVYDPGLEQVTIRRLDNSISHTPMLLLTSHRTDLTENFSIIQKGNHYTLLPKASEKSFHQVVLTFNRGVISAMWLQTRLGQRMLLHFYNVKMNRPLAESQFHFTPPKGVDILNQYDSTASADGAN
ncbi:MAG: outer membrane lipoprotein chaperone LolA [Gammaproteobacteria bacterium]|nr:outer membrane lipoprotein chaperone LolA [Gammaproteobacteria bacterium]MCP4473722.1 outer membrane lipoprotein chaperone LolA [Gammaproteobacteria bacterium]